MPSQYRGDLAGFVKQFVLLLRFLISGGGFVPMGHSLLFAVDAVAAA
jgi:hypothetical protein